MSTQEYSRLATRRLLTLTPKRLMLLIVLGVVTLGGLIALGGGQEAVRALAGVDWRLIGLAVVVHYSGFAVRGLRWQQLLKMMGHQLGWRQATTLLLAGWFVSALLPARAGDILRVGVLRRQDFARAAIPVADSLGSIVLERALDIVAILLLGAFWGFGVTRQQLPGWVQMTYGAGFGAVGLGVGILIWMPALLGWLQGLISHRLWQAALTFGIQLAQSLQTLGRQPTLALLVIGESLYIWLCDALLMWLVVRSLGEQPAFVGMAFVALTVDLLAAIPLTPGGIGQIEAANAALLALVATTQMNIAAVVLVNRAISYWSFLLFSGVVTFVAGLGQFLPTVETQVSLGADQLPG